VDLTNADRARKVDAMYRTLPPHPLLAQWVRCYGALDDVHTRETEEHWLYPECSVLLAFLHGESYLGSGMDERRLPAVYVQEARVFPVRLCSRGRTRLICVEFYPWGAIRLLGMKDAGFDGEGHPCFVPNAVAPLFARRIERLLRADRMDDALRTLEEWLLARAASVGLEATPAFTAATRLFESRGQASVQLVAEEVGLSVRQLERQFQAQVGLSPKQLGRLSRFEAAAHQIFAAQAPSFTRLAHELGYADQAHFNREFRAFATKSPGSFLIETREFVRRANRQDVAFVQAERALVF